MPQCIEYALPGSCSNRGPGIKASPAAALEQLLGMRCNTSPCSTSATGTSITPMEKYDAENANANVVDVLPLMSILLVDAWVPSARGMQVLW